MNRYMMRHEGLMVWITVMSSTKSTFVEVVDLVAPEDAPHPPNSHNWNAKALSNGEKEGHAVAASEITAGANKSTEWWKEDVHDEEAQGWSFVAMYHSVMATSIVVFFTTSSCHDDYLWWLLHKYLLLLWISWLWISRLLRHLRVAWLLWVCWWLLWVQGLLIHI